MSIAEQQSRILVSTLGGSPEPVLEAIRMVAPSFVVFFASRQSVENLGALRATANERGLFFAHENRTVPDAEDMDTCFREAVLIEGLLASKSPSEVVVDVTGGTKAMTASLALAASHWRLPIRFLYVGGRERTKAGLGTVVHGTEAGRFSDSPVALRGMDTYRDFALLFNDHHFGAAARMSMEARPRLMEKLRPLFDALTLVAEGYGAWDLFQHRKARVSLGKATQLLDFHILFESEKRFEPLKVSLQDHIKYLDRLLPAVIHPTRHHLADLRSNAIRREAEGRYDDALARHYRSLEMLGQIRFQERFGVSTSRVPVGKLPASLRESFQARYRRADAAELELPLHAAWTALAADGDPLGKRYEERQPELKGLLAGRNGSILAHGMTPVGERTALGLGALVAVFAKEDGYPDSDALPAFPVLPH